MRIISGNFKGKKILEPKDKLTRPLKDLTKESIFNVIKHSNKFNINMETGALDTPSTVTASGGNYQEERRLSLLLKIIKKYYLF